MPTDPVSRRIRKRNIRNRNQYIAVPRTINSSGEMLNEKRAAQSMLIELRSIAVARPVKARAAVAPSATSNFGTT